MTQLEAWLKTLNIETGPVFRKIRKGGVILPTRLKGDVAEMVKRYVGHAGLDKRDFSGHSLRAGLATSAALAGRSERQIMEQTGTRARRWCASI